MAEDLRVGDLHHGGLHMEWKENALGLGILDLLFQERTKRLDTHKGRIQHFTGLQRDLFLQNRGLTIRANELDFRRRRSGNRARLFIGEEVTVLHVNHVSLGVWRPGSHLMRVFTGIGLHGKRCTAIWITFAQHRIDGTPLHLVVAGLDVLFLVVLRILRIVRQLVPLLLQFLDRGNQLGNRRADIGQLDDIRFRRLGQLA